MVFHMRQNIIYHNTPTFPTINGATNTFGASKYWAHETGVNEVDANGGNLQQLVLLFSQVTMTLLTLKV